MYKWIISKDVSKLLEAFDWPEDPLHDQVAQLCAERDAQGRSTIEFAALLGGRGEFIRELCTRNVLPQNDVNRNGYSALHFAAAWGRVDSLRALYESGWDIHLRTVYGERARETALRYNHPDCVEFLDWADAKNCLELTIQQWRAALADPERVSHGKLSKDDRKLIDSYCTEKSTWMAINPSATTRELAQAKSEMDMLLGPLWVRMHEAASGTGTLSTVSGAPPTASGTHTALGQSPLTPVTAKS